MLNQTSLPFDRDAASSYVPWIIGFMIFLAILALLSISAITTKVRHWENSFVPGFTIEIPLGQHESEALQRSISKTLQNVPGVKSIRSVPKSFLTPFSDTFEFSGTEALFLDATVRNGHRVDLERVRWALASYGKVTIRDHKDWRQDALKIAYTGIIICIVLASFIGLAAIATIAFVARTGLLVHNSTIEILHLVGARHKFIAQQFQAYAVSVARRGSLIALFFFAICALVIITIFGAQNMRSFLQFASMVDVALILILTPLTGVLLTMLSARLTVLSTLARTNPW